MATTKNVFANCATERDLEFEYMMRTSPENISWDGERSAAQVRAAYASFRRQYDERLAEIFNGK